MSEDGQDGAREDVPSTLQRSEEKAQRTYAETRDAAEDRYHDDQRAARTAWAAVKHSYEKVGDHWERKEDEHRGPSDERAEGGLGTAAPTAGGVDVNATKAHLQDLARRAGVPGRSRMTKEQLVEALQKANDRATREARG